MSNFKNFDKNLKFKNKNNFIKELELQKKEVEEKLYIKELELQSIINRIKQLKEAANQDLWSLHLLKNRIYTHL